MANIVCYLPGNRGLAKQIAKQSSRRPDSDSMTDSDGMYYDTHNTVLNLETDDAFLEDAPFEVDPDYKPENQEDKPDSPEDEDMDYQSDDQEDEQKSEEEAGAVTGADADAASTSAEEQDDKEAHPNEITDELRETWVKMRDEYRTSIGYIEPANNVRNAPDYWDHVDYLNERAGPQPPNGPDVKPSGSGYRCLTCIRYGMYCKGSSVWGGRCEHCRGLPSTQKRKCVWIDPDNDLWTYPDAHAAINGTRIPKNSRKGKEAAEEALEGGKQGLGTKRTKSKPKPADATQGAVADPAVLVRLSPSKPAAVPPAPPTHVDQLTDPTKLAILRDAAEQMRQRSMLSQDPMTNIETLFNIIAEHNHLPGLVEDFMERVRLTAIQLEVLHVIRRIKENDQGLTAQEIMTLASVTET